MKGRSRRRLRFYVVSLAASSCALAGCHGPLAKPMVDRLDVEQQQAVDDAWHNMFDPPQRLDPTLLLDVILAQQLHQAGVDSLHLVSEKRVGDGLVVMEVWYDRDEPAGDEFTLAYVDAEGDEIRRERYTRDEVEERFQFLFRPLLVARSADADVPCPTEEELAALQALQRARFEEIRAATQPAATPIER